MQNRNSKVDGSTSASLVQNGMLAECSFFIKKGLHDKQIVSGKIFKTNTGNIFSVHKTRIRHFPETKYKPIMSVSCLRTGYHLAGYKSEKEILENLDWIDALLNSQKLHDEIKKMKREKIPMLNDVSRFR